MLGFLSPEGEWYPCEFNEHLELADKLLKEKYDMEHNNPVDSICRFGWVVIRSAFVGFSGDIMHITPELTEKQKEWLESNKEMLSYDQKKGLTLCLKLNQVLYEEKQ